MKAVRAAGLAFLLFGSTSTSNTRAQVVTENAGTVSPETPIWQSRFEYAKAENVADSRLVETFLWAPDSKMDFGLTLPFVRRDLDLPSGTDGTIAGIGDASLRWKYSWWKQDDVMRSTRFSSLAGVTFPTGSWHEEIEGVDVPRKLQLGTGAFDVFAGPLFTHIDDRHRFAAELIGRYPFEGDGFQLQPSLRVGLAYWYRISPERIEIAGEKPEVRGVLELTSVTYGESRFNGHGLGDNGNITWLSPGIQFFPSLRWLFEASVQVPIVQTVHDVQGDRRFGFVLSLKVLF